VRRLKISIVLQTLLALFLTEAIAIASLFFFRPEMALTVAMPGLTVSQFVVGLLVATAFLFLLMKFFHGRFLFELIFSLSLFGGIWFLSSLFFPGSTAILAASFFTLARFFVPYVMAQNIIMILGLAGVAVALGVATAWPSLLWILIILSVYDIIAVYETKHMVTMFRGLVERGVIFALILPERWQALFTHVRNVKPGEGFSFLGSGDLALPAIFVVSAFVSRPILGIGAAIGSLAGLFFTDLIFVWGRKRPMPALPPIALGTIIGFFLAMFLTKFI